MWDALLFISNSVLEETVDKRPDRAEAGRFFNYSYAAIEEILVNAVSHRSCEIREPVEVRVLLECLTITSCPGPDRSISLVDLGNGRLVARRYRNRRIGEFLKEPRLTKSCDTGIPTVIRAMRDNGSPAPSFDVDAVGLLHQPTGPREHPSKAELEGPKGRTPAVYHPRRRRRLADDDRPSAPQHTCTKISNNAAWFGAPERGGPSRRRACALIFYGKVSAVISS